LTLAFASTVIPGFNHLEIHDQDFFSIKVKVMLRPTVSRPVCLGARPHLGAETIFLLLSDSCGFVYVGHPLDEMKGCRLQFLLGLASTVILVSFDCFRSETPQSAGPNPLFISSRNRVAQLYLHSLGSSLLMSHRSTVELLESPRFIAWTRTTQKTRLPTVLFLRT
jgi:hypothetical protein